MSTGGPELCYASRRGGRYAMPALAQGPLRLTGGHGTGVPVEVQVGDEGPYAVTTVEHLGDHRSNHVLDTPLGVSLTRGAISKDLTASALDVSLPSSHEAHRMRLVDKAQPGLGTRFLHRRNHQWFPRHREPPGTTGGSGGDLCCNRGVKAGSQHTGNHPIPGLVPVSRVSIRDAGNQTRNRNQGRGLIDGAA